MSETALVDKGTGTPDKGGERRKRGGGGGGGLLAHPITNRNDIPWEKFICNLTSNVSAKSGYSLR